MMYPPPSTETCIHSNKRFPWVYGSAWLFNFILFHGLLFHSPVRNIYQLYTIYATGHETWHADLPSITLTGFTINVRVSCFAVASVPHHCSHTCTIYARIRLTSHVCWKERDVNFSSDIMLDELLQVKMPYYRWICSDSLNRYIHVCLLKGKGVLILILILCFMNLILEVRISN